VSDTDSFIDEVTEEVRRDRLFALMRRYGWIAVVVVLLIVGGTAWNEWRKLQARETAQSFGDALMAGLGSGESDARAAALSSVEAPNPGGAAIRDLLAAAESMSVTPQEAASRLLALADSDGADPVYRQIAILKAVAMPGAGLSPEERRARLEGLSLGDGLARLLAQEQLALIDVETGDTEAAIEGLQAIVVDAQATPGLRRRASQVIVALGGELPGSGQGE